jgi:hypothetical protein
MEEVRVIAAGQLSVTAAAPHPARSERKYLNSVQAVLVSRHSENPIHQGRKGFTLDVGTDRGARTGALIEPPGNMAEPEQRRS